MVTLLLLCRREQHFPLCIYVLHHHERATLKPTNIYNYFCFREHSPEGTLVAPPSTPGFFTPNYKKKTRQHRRRSNTYNTDSRVAPRELIPNINSETTDGMLGRGKLKSGR